MSPTTPPSADQPTTSRSTAKVPSRLAGWRRLAWDWQEIGWLALLIPIAVFVSEIANTRERAGQSPLSWFADLAQLAAAVAVASLLAWLLKRALIGDLTDGEINAARHHVREGTARSDGSRYLLALDAIGSIACYIVVVLTWLVFVRA